MADSDAKTVRYTKNSKIDCSTIEEIQLDLKQNLSQSA